MRPHLLQIWHIAQAFLTFIGGTTVAGLFVWLWKRGQENFENTVLKMFMRDPQQPIRNATGIRADFYFDLFRGAPTIFHSATSGNFWVKLRWWFGRLPFCICHFWPRRLVMPSQKRIDRAIMQLWRDGHLLNATGSPGYYKLKP
jgi:hypothetical protein